MKKLILLLVLCGAMPLTMMAQDDDLYFTPKKSAKAERAEVVYDNRPAYYVGSNRSVDEYNRRGRYRSSYQTISGDSVASDVISFEAGAGVYPDSAYIDTTFVFSEYTGNDFAGGYDDSDDYRCTRYMSRWDGYCAPWHYGWHSPFWYSRYGWYDPWYYDWCYDPWYYGWYDPWYAGGYWGWHRWHGWYGGWYDPWFGHYPGWGGVAVRPNRPGGSISGTGNHGLVAGRPGNGKNTGSSRFGNRRTVSTATSQSTYRFGSRSYNTGDSRNNTYRNNSYTPSNSQSTPSFSGSRSIGSSSSSGGFSGGGTRSGGFSGGGGGGHFGGRR